MLMCLMCLFAPQAQAEEPGSTPEIVLEEDGDGDWTASVGEDALKFTAGCDADVQTLILTNATSKAALVTIGLGGEQSFGLLEEPFTLMLMRPLTDPSGSLWKMEVIELQPGESREIELIFDPSFAADEEKEPGEEYESSLFAAFVDRRDAVAVEVKATATLSVSGRTEDCQSTTAK